MIILGGFYKITYKIFSPDIIQIIELKKDKVLCIHINSTSKGSFTQNIGWIRYLIDSGMCSPLTDEEKAKLL